MAKKTYSQNDGLVKNRKNYNVRERLVGCSYLWDFSKWPWVVQKVGHQCLKTCPCCRRSCFSCGLKLFYIFVLIGTLRFYFNGAQEEYFQALQPPGHPDRYGNNNEPALWESGQFCDFFFIISRQLTSTFTPFRIKQPTTFSTELLACVHFSRTQVWSANVDLIIVAAWKTSESLKKKIIELVARGRHSCPVTEA